MCAKKDSLSDLPQIATDYIESVIKAMGYRRKVRQEVRQELADHFTEALALKDCTDDQQREKEVRTLIEGFGDIKILGKLMRRGKKRCRPLWRTVVARGFQAVGIFIICLIVYMAWFLTGKPNPTIDYVAQWNREVRPVADDSLNAWQYYRKAAEMRTEEPEDMPGPLETATPEEKAKIVEWVASNEQALKLVAAGNELPYYWMEYKYESGEALDILLPNLADFKRLGYAFCWRALFEAEQGLYENAFSDIKSCYELGMHIRGEVTLIEQLVAMALEQMATNTLRKIVSKYEVETELLSMWQRQLEEIVNKQDFIVNVIGERFLIYDEIQRCFTDDRIGGGHLYPQRLKELDVLFAGDGPFGFNEFFEEFRMVMHGIFTHPNKQETREMADRFYDLWQQLAQKTPYERHTGCKDIYDEIDELIEKNILLNILAPAMDKVITHGYKSKSNIEGTITVLAILRFEHAKSRYPENLEELVSAGYLGAAAMDPFSDRPLVYKKSDGGFILYSVSENFTDDSGVAYKDKKGREKLWHKEGDAFFWPAI